MPIYEYACPSCNNRFELLVRGRERPACPQCGGRRLERFFSVPAAHTSGKSSPLPICETDGGPSCGPDFCRTGQCEF